MASHTVSLTAFRCKNKRHLIDYDDILEDLKDGLAINITFDRLLFYWAILLMFENKDFQKLHCQESKQPIHTRQGSGSCSAYSKFCWNT